MYHTLRRTKRSFNLCFYPIDIGGTSIDVSGSRAHHQEDWRFALNLDVGGETNLIALQGAVGPLWGHLGVGSPVTRLRSASYRWAKRKAEENKAASRSNPFVYAYQLDPMQGRRTGVDLTSLGIGFSVWASDDHVPAGHSDWPWNGSGWRWHLDIKRLLLGPLDSEWRRLSSEQLEIPMSEGTYRAVRYFEEHRSRRGKLRWAEWEPIQRIEIADGIPFPGKGENAWDCGDDRLYGISVPVDLYASGGSAVSSWLADEVARRRGGAAYPCRTERLPAQSGNDPFPEGAA